MGLLPAFGDPERAGEQPDARHAGTSASCATATVLFVFAPRPRGCWQIDYYQHRNEIAWRCWDCFGLPKITVQVQGCMDKRSVRVRLGSSDTLIDVSAHRHTSAAVCAPFFMFAPPLLLRTCVFSCLLPLLLRQISEMMRRMTRTMEHSEFVDGLESVLRSHCDVSG